jgi:hypothetical protein
MLARRIPPSITLERLTVCDAQITGDDPSEHTRFAREQLCTEGLDFARLPQAGQVVWITSRIRQVGIVDTHGRAAVHDGGALKPWAGSVTGNGFACLGNLLTGEAVLRAMASAFVSARNEKMPLAACLLRALMAGDAEGGDRRGRQSAAILIARDRSHWSGSDRYCSVRVDQDPNPVDALRRALVWNGFVSECQASGDASL